MGKEATEQRTDGDGAADKSAKETEDAPAPSRAEVSNYEIVEHWFGVAAERLGEIIRRASRRWPTGPSRTALRCGLRPTSWASKELSRQRPPAAASSTSVQFG